MKFYDLFSGIGGFRLGLERNGFECVGSCEIDKYARQIYEKQFGCSELEFEHDARELVPSSMPDFDILTAGFPCQAFSIAGKRMGFSDTRGTLFFEIARITKEARPKILLLENVKGLLNHDGGRTFGTILNTLYELGYDIEWQIINGKYFVPQNRERVFIIGHLREKPTREIFPVGEINQEHDSSCTEAQGEGERIRSSYTRAIDTRYGQAGVSTRTIDSNYWKGGSHGTMIKLVDIRQNYRVYGTDGISPTGGHHIPMFFMAHTKGNIKQRNQNRKETWTLDTSSSKMALQDNDRIRKLTPLECERLMGFPDNWTDILSDTQRYKVIGNAVIVPIVEYIGQFLKNI